MKILYLDWACFGGIEFVNYFTECGAEVISFSHKEFKERNSQAFRDSFEEMCKDNDFDFAFSYNFWPMMARCCKDHNLKYISFVYDSPHINMYSYTIAYDTNYVFVFDSAVADEFQANGLSRVMYMPLPVVCDKYKLLETKDYKEERVEAEVSFVGALYNEDHNLLDNLQGLSDRTLGYIDGLIKAQSKVYGYNFIKDCLTKDIVDDLQSKADFKINSDGVESLEYLFSDYFICRKLTSFERMDLLGEIAKSFDLKLFTIDSETAIGSAKNMGVTDYFTEMPLVFNRSKINLNLSMRSIKKGIPLRAMDIMANGGFLLTNYQEDFLRHFVPGEDFVYFESKEDMMSKIAYYLSHEDERKAIANSGYEKVKKYHNYRTVFDDILSICEIA